MIAYPSIASFEAGTLDIGAFNHEAHVYVAWSYLNQYTLPTGIERFSQGLRKITAAHGVPGKYHETITWFFMLMVAQRRALIRLDSWESFRQANLDLVTDARALLHRYYSPALIESELARRVFVLPEPDCPERLL